MKKLLSVLLILLLACTAGCSTLRTSSADFSEPASTQISSGEEAENTTVAQDKTVSSDEKTDSAASDGKPQSDATGNTETTDGKKTPEKKTEKTTKKTSQKTPQKDKYNTDPVPEGKPAPTEPQDTEPDKENPFICTILIECKTILDNLDDLDPDKREIVPRDGVILAKTTVTFYDGESVFDLLQRICKEKKIHMESSFTPMYNSAYIEGIANLYEFDCGPLSGWMYSVNGWYPNYGCSRYSLSDEDIGAQDAVQTQ